MAKIAYDKCETVYVCCGEYLVPTLAADKRGVTCPRCGKLLTEPIEKPTIVLVKVK